MSRTNLLKNIVVLDLTRILAGPIATMILGDLGAEIIKVEPPKGDDTRRWAPIINGKSIYYLSINRNKKSISIDLKQEKGRDILYRLVKKSDVLIHNFRVDTAYKLGVDYDSIKNLKKDIIYCSITGFRSGSIYSSRKAGDIIIQALSGLMDSTGYEDTPPIRIPFALFDIFAGYIAAISIVASLLRREKDGKGIKIEVPLYDTAIFSMSYIPLIYLSTGIKPIKMGSAHPSIVPYQAFRCRDDRYLVVGAFNNSMWRSLCKALGLEHIIEDPRYRDNIKRVENRMELEEILANIFRRRNRDEWIKYLSDRDILVAPVYSLDEVFKDPYIDEAEIITTLFSESLGETYQLIFPAIFNNKKPYPKTPPPSLGENTREILIDLGYDEKMIDKLVREKIICLR